MSVSKDGMTDAFKDQLLRPDARVLVAVDGAACFEVQPVGYRGEIEAADQTSGVNRSRCSAISGAVVCSPVTRPASWLISSKAMASMPGLPIH